MFKYLKDEKLQLFWIIFHTLIGLSAISTKWVLIGWFYVVVISTIISLFGKEPEYVIMCVSCYILGFEILARGVHASPYIPAEVGKYFVLFMFAFGISIDPVRKQNKLYGVSLLLLSIPALFFASYSYKQIVFNYLGILTLIIGVIFYSRHILTLDKFIGLCRIMVYSILMLCMYAVFRASSFEKLEFNVSANFQTAGTITNQVSSLLGTGATIIVLIYVTGKSIFNKFIDIILLLLFFGVGLISFSRGGVISGLIAILLILLFPRIQKSYRNKSSLDIDVQNISPVSIILIIGVFAFSFFVINSISDNYLYYRYMGKTEREIKTGFDKDFNANKFSSGRAHIMEGDINIFLDNPGFGVGVGNSRYVRMLGGKPLNIASHTEATRLLAEHGSLGLIMFFMIFIYPIFKAFGERSNFQRLLIISFFTISITVTFHNAMRTCITPVLFALTFLLVVPNNIDKSYFSARRTTIFKRRTPIPNNV